MSAGGRILAKVMIVAGALLLADAAATNALWVTRRVAYDRLILSACHPLFSAAQRIVVFARLVSAVPRGAAA